MGLEQEFIETRDGRVARIEHGCGLVGFLAVAAMAIAAVARHFRSM